MNSFCLYFGKSRQNFIYSIKKFSNKLKKNVIEVYITNLEEQNEKIN